MPLSKFHDSASEISPIEAETIDLCRQHMSILLEYAADRTGDQAAIQDGIKGIFLRYFVLRTKGQQIENPRVWLVQMLRKFIRDYDRSADSMRGSSLSLRERECIRLRMAGFSHEDIAQILDIPRRSMSGTGP
jgi:DNA-directed RNA polymerase specialized sigma24 family protein